MEKKMTAVQELLQWVRKNLPMDLDYPQMIESKLEQALTLEREQIEGANLRGFYCGIDLSNGVSPDFKSASDYYIKTYSKPLKDKI